MTGTAIAVPNQLPAFLQRQDLQQYAQKFNTEALGGIKVGGFPRISIAGSKFFIIDSSAEDPRQLITTQDPQTGAMLPSMALACVVVGTNPGLTKTYYEGAFQPGDDREPDCSSDDGVTPDAHILSPQNTACATCPKNAWGSKITPQGTEVKACSDSKRLVILAAHDLNFKALGLTITPASLKEWGAYMRTLNNRNVPVFGVVTRITFDVHATFPKLNFTFERFLSEQEFGIVSQRMQSDEVKNIERPMRSASVAALPAPVAPQTQPILVSQPLAVQTQIAPAPVAPPTPTSVQGFQPVVSVQPAPPNVEPQVAEPPKPKRGRPRNPVPQPDASVQQPAAPSPFGQAMQAIPVGSPPQAPPPAPAQQSFTTAPAANVVQPDSQIASELDALLASVMGGQK